METADFFAKPWWVNLLALIPPLAYGWWRRQALVLSGSTLLTAAIFAAAFGFLEASVVVYLRAASGLLPGYQGTLADVQRLSTDTYRQASVVPEVPRSLLTVEVCREAVTMIMLITLALLAGRTCRDRCALFLWAFAGWDIFYYVGLWVLVRWPSSLSSPDVLFLIPVPWFSPVWFPILVSLLTMVAVVLATIARPARDAR